MTSIAIPNSVTKIGGSAFYGCTGLTNVTIGNSVAEIGNMAFSWCENLTSIIVDGENKAYDSRDNCNAIIETASNTLVAGCNSTVIPNTVSSIGYYAFSGCTGLESIIIPNSVTLIDECAFNGCKKLKNVTIGNSVTEIGYSAFSACPLTSVTIPNSVTKIDQYAFYYCQELESLYLGKSVATIGNSAFSDCENLKSIVVDNENTTFDSRDNCNAIIETATNKIVKGTSASTIPNTVTAIGNSAFEFCKDLTSITIPSSVTGIGEYAFYGCTNLKSIVIPKTVEVIAYCAFACSDELKVYVEWEDEKTIRMVCLSSSIFTYDCKDYGTLYIPNGTLSIYKSSSPWNYFRNIVEYDPAGVEEIKAEGGVTIGVEGGKIVVSGAGDAKVEVFGTNGAAVYSGSADNLPELAAGIYIVRVGSTVKKVAVAQ